MQLDLDSNFMIIQVLGTIIVFKSYWPNISAADGGWSWVVEAIEVRELGESSDKKRLCVAAHSASACDGRRNAAIIAEGRLCKIYHIFHVFQKEIK